MSRKKYLYRSHEPVTRLFVYSYRSYICMRIHISFHLTTHQVMVAFIQHMFVKNRNKNWWPWSPRGGLKAKQGTKLYENWLMKIGTMWVVWLQLKTPTCQLNYSWQLAHHLISELTNFFFIHTTQVLFHSIKINWKMHWKSGRM